MTARHAFLLALALLAPAKASFADALQDCKALEGGAAIGACDRAIRENPKAALPYFFRGAAYAGKGDFDRALADFDRAIQIDPKHLKAYSFRATAHVGKGDLRRAVADLTRAIEIDPKSVEARNDRGKYYVVMSDFDRALADFTKSIEIDPKEASSYNFRGVTRKKMGDNDRAIADYTRAIELSPDYAAAYYNRGMVYSAKGTAGRGAPSALPATGGLLGVLAGGGSTHLADLDRAIADFSKAIENDPDFADAYAARGTAKHATRDTAGGDADLAKARAIRASGVPQRPAGLP